MLPSYTTTWGRVASYGDEELAALGRRYYQVRYGVRRVVPCRSVHHLRRWCFVRPARIDRENDIAWYPDLLPLREALERWAGRFHLAADWVYDNALLQLDTWHMARAKPTTRGACDPFRKPLKWMALMGGAWFEPDTEPLRFVFAAWAPTSEKRAQYKARARAAFEEALEEYLGAAEAQFRGTPGFAHTTRATALRNHFAWAVRYQVLEESYAVIGGAVGVHHQGVRDAVHDILALIDLPRRPPKRGPRPC
ncbi:MAG: hypothetical protein Kow00122_11020 [Thermoleophilia bacterium]